MKYILQNLKDEDVKMKFKDDIKGIIKLGRYEVEWTRSMRVVIKSQADEILTGSYVLTRVRYTKMCLSCGI